MSLREPANGEATIIALSGALDSQIAGQLRDAAARIAHDHNPVVIEMSEVTDLAAPVVGVLVGAWHYLSDRLTLRVSPPVFAAFEEVGLSRMLPVAQPV
ncbi:MAG TPA: STAS domain-containing protein [Frankiaceae bacterium]|jgi:anti-anti-sigma regulatory factor|nr:STAS domain-containing protein [Frankiaceae bacterium]